ncbi:MAG: hypothetical protein FVQ84_21255 [Planctomycetes bacterium]|nr:hypothetical protein [Planctomycetota bacterium]
MVTPEANKNIFNFCSNKTFIISITVVLVVIIVMYFRDRQQQHVFELRRLEKRVEMLEELGMPRQQNVW